MTVLFEEWWSKDAAQRQNKAEAKFTFTLGYLSGVHDERTKQSERLEKIIAQVHGVLADLRKPQHENR
jgi:hypothetical protein